MSFRQTNGSASEVSGIVCCGRPGQLACKWDWTRSCVVTMFGIRLQHKHDAHDTRRRNWRVGQWRGRAQFPKNLPPNQVKPPVWITSHRSQASSRDSFYLVNRDNQFVIHLISFSNFYLVKVDLRRQIGGILENFSAPLLRPIKNSVMFQKNWFLSRFVPCCYVNEWTNFQVQNMII